MTLRVMYQWFCDTCGAGMEPQQTFVPTNGVLPQPPQAVVLNGIAVCDTCAKIAVAAMNEALKSRLKKEPSDDEA